MLYLIPTYLGENSPKEVFPIETLKLIPRIHHYIVENEKSARRFLRFIYPEVNQSQLVLRSIGKGFRKEAIDEVTQDLTNGHSVGLLSEAGTPCIADPGNLVVEWAHQHEIKVHPLVGPSSILLALMASGMNGQHFEFHGYLPITQNEKKKTLKKLEQESVLFGKTQIFMETPYRNESMLKDLLQTLKPHTQLCIATDISLATEDIFSAPIHHWKNRRIALNKRPSIFLIEA